MNALKSLAFEAVFMGLAAAGWVWDIDAARWALHALVWAVMLPTALVCAVNPQLQALTAARLPRSNVIRLCNLVAWLVVLAVVLWHGAWVTGAAVAMCLLCGFVYHDAVTRLRAAKEQHA